MTRTRRHPAPPSERLRLLRLGDDAPRCARCGCDTLAALGCDAEGAVCCYRCATAVAGRPARERHHPGGRGVPGTIAVDGNLHRRLSETQAGWPEGVLTNRDGDPLLAFAGIFLALRDAVDVAPPRGVGYAVQSLRWGAALAARVAAWLVRLSAVLRERHGVRWWASLGLSPLFPPRGAS